MTISAAIWATPLAVAMVLLPVRNERLGGSSGGADYALKAGLDAKNRAKDFLETHFEIVPESPEEIGWQLGSNTYLKI